MSVALSVAHQHITSASVALFHHAQQTPPSERLRRAAMELEEVLHLVYLERLEAAGRDEGGGDIHAAV
jgi:hypothetical protein